MEYPIYNKTLSYDDKFVKYWLLGLLLLLLLMILIGGLTRLTDLDFLSQTGNLLLVQYPL